MTRAEYQAKFDYYTTALGDLQIKVDESYKWEFELIREYKPKMKQAFIYLNTLSRYDPEGTNVITDQQAEFIFLQLEKLRL